MREVASVAEDIIQSVRVLLQVFSEDETHGIEHGRNEYLMRTGAVHDLITSARAPGGVPTDNLASVRKKWKQHYEAMHDGLTEIDEMIQDAQASGREEDVEDDGWNELGLPSNQKMDGTELERAKKVVMFSYLPLLLSHYLDLYSYTPFCVCQTFYTNKS